MTMTRCGQALLLAATLLLSTTPTRAEPLTPDPGQKYHTGQLIGRTLQALPACLKYCLLGIEIRLRYTGYTVEVYFVPRVEHHMSALHGMASDRFPKEAYIEWAQIVGEIQKQLLDQMAAMVPTAFHLPGVGESSGGQTRYGQYGDHQSTNFKEVEFMGHPVAILPALIDGNGNISVGNIPAGSGSWGSAHLGAGGGGGGGDSTGVSGFINQWSRWARGCFAQPNDCSMGPTFPADIINQYFDIAATIQQVAGMAQGVMDFPKMAKTIRDIADEIGKKNWKDEIGAGGGVKMDRLLCLNDIKLFYPYYLSGPDALFWRSGWPITDVQHTVTMLNPLSNDQIGRTGEIWGHVYPRHGFLNHDHPGRVAPTLSYRGAHLLADENAPLRPKLTTWQAHGDWQSISPQPTTYCAANIADLPTPIDAEGGYGYNVWPRYECPLSTIGFFFAFIPYKYCFY